MAESKEDRARRLAEELRANLRKRKAQAREQRGGGDTAERGNPLTR